MSIKRKIHKPKDLKLVPPTKSAENDNGRTIWNKVIKFYNGELHLGRVYVYHPTKGWRSRGEKKFVPYGLFQGIKTGVS